MLLATNINLLQNYIIYLNYANFVLSFCIYEKITVPLQS